MTVLFVIGNGKSRKEFDVNLLKTYGKIIACNSAFRDIDCDALAVDHATKLLALKEQPDLELIMSIRDEYRSITWDDEIIGVAPNIQKRDERYSFWDSGRVALIAGLIKYQPKKVYLIGFDFLDIPILEQDSPEKPVNRIRLFEKHSNNMYHDRYIQRPKYIEQIYNWVVDEYPDVKFYRVGPLSDPILDKLEMGKITYAEFKDKHL